MIKDGIREKVAADLHRLFDPVLAEPVPQYLTDVLEGVAAFEREDRAGGVQSPGLTDGDPKLGDGSVSVPAADRGSRIRPQLTLGNTTPCGGEGSR